MVQKKPYICWFEDICADDVAIVGGKNASLGAMIRALKDEGIRVPDGFTTTAQAFQEFSDFKTNEYADLIGGRAFEPREENPMLGFRGAAHYDSD